MKLKKFKKNNKMRKILLSLGLISVSLGGVATI
jgi:hypothetical protein